MGFLTNVILGPQKKKQQSEPETQRIMVVEEPGPTTREQIGNWMNKGTIPDKLTRMDEKIGSMFGRVRPYRKTDDNQFIQKKTRKYGDPNNINQIFDDKNMFPKKRRR